VSLLFPDQYRIGLGATYAVLAKVQGRKVLHWQMQSWSDTELPTLWQRPLSAVASWLAQLKSRVNVTVALSADLAPMQLLPWREDATNSEQQALLASVHFRAIYGESADGWKIITQPCGYGQPWLACGVNELLLSALREQFKGTSVASVMPLPVSLFNTLRTKLPPTASWLLMPELESITALYWCGGRLELLQTLPVNLLRHEAIADILLRETLLAGLKQAPVQFYTASARADLNNAISLDAGWQRGQDVPSNAPLHLLGGAV